MSLDQHLDLAEITELRHHLHTMPEISGEERETAAYIRQFLETTAADKVISDIGGYGVMATYQGTKEKPEILLRCELDALPVKDKAEGISYISRNEDTGHKCGHDGHMAIICGVARMLARQDLTIGTVHLLFQPEEETGQGAEKVLNDSRFNSISPDYCFALHNLPGYPLNQVVVRDGLFAAASVGMTVQLQGSTSHAASPETGKSPALAMSQLIETLSAAPQFNIPFGESAKVTVVYSELGEPAFGTSPGRAEIMATLRTTDEILLKKLKKYCRNISEGIAAAYDLKCRCSFTEYFPATLNDSESVDAIIQAARHGNISIKEKETPFGWSEDFGHFTKKYRGAIFGLGSGKNHPSLHAETYDFPDKIIPTGIEMFLNIIQHLNRR